MGFYFIHSTIVIFWPYIDNLGLSRCFLAQIWYLVLTLSYNIIDIMVLWKKNVSLFWKLLFHPSLPLHCVTVRKKNKISNANIPHLECQKPMLTSIYNTIGDKTVILGCTKKFSISKSLKKKTCTHIPTYLPQISLKQNCVLPKA